LKARNSSIAGQFADPDGDGLINLLEQEYGTDPNLANVSPAPPTINLESESGVLKADFAPVANVATIHAEVSDDLISWGTIGISTSLEQGRTVERDSLDVQSAPRRFMRLEIRRSESYAD